MIHILIQKKYFPWLLFFFAFGLFSLNNGGISIYFLDEAKNAECAREMLEEGDLLKPTFNYTLRHDKPPLHYFFMMGSYLLFGINEWSARFFSALFGALTLFITFLYTRKFLNARVAFYACLILLSSIHLNIQFHFAVPDPYFIFFLCWSFFLFYSALTTGKQRDILLMYVSIGLAVLAKGPAGLLLPGLVFLLYLIVTRQFTWTQIKNLSPFTGAAIVLLIVLPWFILNGVETNGVWTKDFFLRHNLYRFTNEMEGHGGIFLVPFFYVFAGMLPFIFFIIPAIKPIWKAGNTSCLFYFLMVALSLIVFFSLSQTKLPNYTVPAYPFLAIVIAWYLTDVSKTRKSIIRAWMWILFVLMVLVPVGGYFALRSDPVLRSAAPWAWWLSVLPAGSLGALILQTRKKTEASLRTLGYTFILASVLFFLLVFPAVDKHNPVAKSLPVLKNKEVAYYKKFNPSYSFYLKRKIPELNEDEIPSFFENNPGGVLISTQRHIEELHLPEEYTILFSGKDLFENPVTVLVSQQP
jgi:4-amino-4-deoxy-L-arabinose transferase-like glycosyltransferase